MKLRIAILSLMAASLFIVACGGGDASVRDEARKAVTPAAPATPAAVPPPPTSTPPVAAQPEIPDAFLSDISITPDGLFLGTSTKPRKVSIKRTRGRTQVVVRLKGITANPQLLGCSS